MNEAVTHPQKNLGAALLRQLPIVVIFVAILLSGILFQFGNSNFLSAGNLANIGRQATYLTIFAVAQAMVLKVRGFDLSLGPTVSLVSVICAVVMTSFADPFIAVVTGIAAGLGVAALIGLFNGLLVGFVGLNPFVVTLGTMNIVVAIATTATGGFPVTGLPESFGFLAFSSPLNIPIQLWLVASLLIIYYLVENWTVLGRSQVLIGSSPKAAALGGVSVRFQLMATYLLCSLTIGIGAVLLTARTASGEPNLGGDLTLESIAAAVLGGMSPRGGQGSLISPILGALFLAIIANGMDAAAINGYVQQIILGGVIVTALAIDLLRRR